jgi:2-methylisocitrate lyase-like PEP mutase family enzyme
VRLIEQAGFKTASISGAGVSESRMGWADRGVMTFEENLNNARRLADCSDLLLRADADTGYGNAMTVHFVVRAFEKAGVAALMIEDQVWPKRCGHMAGKACIPAEEMVIKLRAAIAARRNPETVIIARSDATAVTGLDDAIARSRMYADAGADVIFIDAPTCEDDLKAIANGGINAVLMANVSEYGKTPDLGAQRFQELGFGLLIYPSSTLFAAAQSTKELAAQLKADGSTVASVPRMMPFDELNDILGKDQWDSLEDNLRGTT